MNNLSFLVLFMQSFSCSNLDFSHTTEISILFKLLSLLVVFSFCNFNLVSMPLLCFNFVVLLLFIVLGMSN